MNDSESQHIPLIGEMLPTMQVQTTHGPKTLPNDYAGKWLVLFSHPADFTPVCTTEFVSFQKNYAKFREMNTELLGLSVDQVFSHIKWTEWIKEHFDVEIEFPIIADTGLVSGKLGFIHPGKNHDTNTVRAVFVIWPNNELFGSDVIIPPAKDVTTVKERFAAAKAGEFTCEDWWLCHKPLN